MGSDVWRHRIACIITFLCVLTVPVQLFSQTRADTILYTGDFLRIPAGARSCGMGDADVALYLGPQSILINPAVLSSAKSIDVGVEGALLFGVSRQALLSAVAPIGSDITIGGGYAPFFSGDIVYSDSLPETYSQRLVNPSLRANGSVESVFSNNQHEVVISVARLFRINSDRSYTLASYPLPITVSCGASLKGFWQTLDPKGILRMGFGVNADIGALAAVGLDYDFVNKNVSRQLTCGVSLRNILPTSMKWVNSPAQYEEPLHLDQNYGIAYLDESGLLHARWLVSFALKRQFGDNPDAVGADSSAAYQNTVHGGLEAFFFDMVGVRVGFSNAVFTLGASVVYKHLSLDYALRFDDLALSPIRLSLQYGF